MFDTRCAKVVFDDRNKSPLSEITFSHLDSETTIHLAVFEDSMKIENYEITIFDRVIYFKNVIRIFSFMKYFFNSVVC